MGQSLTKGMTLGRAGSRGLLWSVVFFSVFTNLLLLTGPLFMLQVYDRVLTSRSEETLTALFGLVAGLYLLYGLIEFARSRVMSRIGARVQAMFSGPVFEAVVARAAMGGRDRTGTLGDLDAVRTVLSSPVVLSVLDLPWTPMFVAVIFIFHPMLGWLALGGGVVIVALAVVNQLITGAATREGLQRLAGASALGQEAETSGDFLRAQGMVGAMRTRWEDGQGAAMERSISAADRTGAIASFTRAFRLFLQSAMLALGAWLVLKGDLTAGAMIAASILLGRALAPVEQSVGQWQTIQRGRAAWRDLKALLAQSGPEEAPTRLPEPKAQLDVTGVSVIVRRGEPPALSQVSFSCAPGEALGIIGRSGSGKTTLARVVVGLVAPAAGEVRLDGATLAQYGHEVLGGHIGYLPQEVCLFRGTVAENIAHMEAEPDAERLVAAAKKARVHDIILKLPDGYDTRIGPADAALSGGQRQRLALARALYRDPVLLVLDEPNSALDADGSEALNAVVTAMKAEGRAVLIMTHRPTAISTCDRLLVLDAGKVAAYGPRDEVVKSMMKNASDVQRVMAREGGR